MTVAFLSAAWSPIGLADTRAYPAGRPAPLIVGEEDYNKNYISLAGIEGVHVPMTILKGATKKRGYHLDENIEAEIRARFAAADIKLLTKEEAERTPGQPVLDIYPGYSHAANASTESEDHNSLQCCRNSVWVSFSQAATILRSPDRNFRFSTWGGGDDTNMCAEPGQWMSEAVLEKVDAFIADIQKARKEVAAQGKPVGVTKVGELRVA
ncbi:MAG: hypothetical protein K0U93_25640, partial [Gammaproteobacteria bacterium]|nr:hypothetical protein [Gammaproteobacteria bacterium]